MLSIPAGWIGERVATEGRTTGRLTSNDVATRPSRVASGAPRLQWYLTVGAAKAAGSRVSHRATLLARAGVSSSTIQWAGRYPPSPPWIEMADRA
jgi:hypothetical protein